MGNENKIKAEQLAKVAIQDPLSETTRKERKTLLGIAIVIIGIIKTGMMPTKIEALGIEFSQTDQKYIFHIFAAIVIYYLVAFLLFSISDFIAWRIAVGAAWKAQWESNFLTDKEKPILTADEQRIKQLEKQVIELKAEMARGDVRRQMGMGFDFENLHLPQSLIRISNPISILRGLFEFLLPLVVGFYALILLLTHIP